MSRLVGRVDVEARTTFVVRRPEGADSEWWARVVRSLAAAAEQVGDDEVHVLVSRAAVLRRLLGTGPSAGARWMWSTAATKAAARAQEVARSVRIVTDTPVQEQSAHAIDGDLARAGFARELLPFQRIAVARLLHAGRGADFSVPGSGKTTVAYAVWAALRAAGRVHGLIVVAPPSAFEAWSDEAAACFAPGFRPTVRIRPPRLHNSDNVVVLNYESLSDVRTVAAVRAWMENRKVLVVFDEAHRAKAGQASQRGAAAADLARMADACIVLTGTPMPNQESDLVAIFDLVWPGHGNRLVDGDLATRRERAFVRVTKSDLDLPVLDLRVEKVALDAQHRRVYDAMVAAVGDWAHGPEVTAAEAGRALMRLIAAATNPAAVFDPGAPWTLSERMEGSADLAEVLADPSKHINAAKVVRASQIVTENRAAGKKTLVWSNFVDNVRVIAEALAPCNPAMIVGATPVDDPGAASDRRRELERFRSDPDCWVLVATPQTLGEGISLHKTCTDQIHVDRGFAAATWLQAIDRTYRLGLPRESRPRCTVIEAEGTIDARVAEILSAKVARMSEVLDDHALRPLADPMILPGDPVAAVLGDIDALRELFAAI